MKPYKYNIGDKVKYKTYDLVEKECPTCGHIEEETIEKKEVGVIESKEMVSYIRHQDFVTTDESTIAPDGTIIHKPYLAPLTVINNDKEPSYKINDNWYSEDKIIKKL